MKTKLKQFAKSASGRYYKEEDGDEIDELISWIASDVVIKIRNQVLMHTLATARALKLPGLELFYSGP